MSTDRRTKFNGQRLFERPARHMISVRLLMLLTMLALFLSLTTIIVLDISLADAGTSPDNAPLTSVPAEHRYLNPLAGTQPRATIMVPVHGLGERGLSVEQSAKGNQDTFGASLKSPIAATADLIKSPDNPQVITSGNWANVYPHLTAVSAISITEAWAIGDYGNLLHYINNAWETVALSNTWFFQDIDMVSADSGWIAAEYNGDYATLEYDGTGWIEHSTGNLRLTRISALSSTDVWAIGTDSQGQVIAHWDGTSWTNAGPALNSTHLTDIHMLSATDGWAAGWRYSSGSDINAIYHYDGTNWTYFTPPRSLGYITTITSIAPGDVWAVGCYTYPSCDGHIYHYINGSWTSMLSPEPGEEASEIEILSSNEGYITTGFRILKWDGNIEAWTIENTPSGSFLDISGVSRQVWAVGNGETILSKSGTGSWLKQRGGPLYLTGVSVLSTEDAWAVGGGGFLHYSNGTWLPVTSSVTAYSADIQMLSPTEGYVVGNQVIAAWDGTEWAAVAQPSVQLNELSMLGSGQGWAVGEQGQIWQASKGSWTQASSPVTDAISLSAVSMSSPSHGWAVGVRRDITPYSSVLLEYDGTLWQDRSYLIPADVGLLEDVIVDGTGANGWAVGSRSQTGTSIMHLSAGIWVSDPYTDADYLEKVSFDASGEVWAIGYSGLYHNINGTWQSVALPTTDRFYTDQVDLDISPGRGGWVVTPRGTILRYNPLADGRRFYDVAPDSTFYSFIECMAERNIIGGYQQDNTFRPSNNVTRGQLSKIVSNAAGYSEPAGAQMFEDVQPGSTFYDFVQRLASRSYINGYPCGGVGEPCGIGNLPYFRANANANRGQISKIVSNAAGFSEPPANQMFEDVQPGSTFYDFVQRLASRGYINGYPCGGVGEPCGIGNLSYFRPNNNATRGQTSKIVANTFFPDCQTSKE